ncbi:MAG TPA: MFS transporter [Acetobacteraceae bacterium]|nr:MFS transporter [Acetobacteraceae bacterium]
MATSLPVMQSDLQPAAGGRARFRASYDRVRDRSVQLHQRLKPKRLYAPSLDWANFLIADVRGALGPYVVVYLVTEQHWQLAPVGLVTTLGGWIGLVMQTPIGAWLDHTNRKRGLLLGALGVLSLGALILALTPSFWPVLLANSMMQVVSGVFEPAVAALTVGLCARDALTRRMGRNAAWARAGNIVVAGTSGFAAWVFTARAVFLQVPLIALLTAIAVLTIPHEKVDLRRARGLKQEKEQRDGPVGWLTLFRSRPMLVFGACSLLYELADAPLLTLVSQQIGVEHEGWGATVTSTFIVAAQLGMLVTSILVGRRADAWGYRWLLAVGFALLPVQAALTVLSHKVYWLTLVQFVGGLGGGLFAALTPLWLADATRGTGRYNLSQGAMGTLRAVGVTSSGLLSEMLVDRLGYNAAYAGCGVIGALAVALLWFALPDPQATEHPTADEAPRATFTKRGLT